MQNTFTKADLDDLTYDIVGSAIEVHKHLGPRLLESIYPMCALCLCVQKF